jgi:hypothetical protein
MFGEACERARHYTCPYVGLRRKHDGTVISSVAAFIVVNDRGWCITAKHLFDEIARAEQSIVGAAGLDDRISALKSQKGGDAKHRNRELGTLEHERRESLSNRVEIWAAGSDWATRSPRAMDVRLHPVADVATFKLEPFTPPSDQMYPVFRSTALTAGVSICRIGFPWHTVEADFANNNFDVKSGFPAPFFALDGMISRFASEETPDGAHVTYIQTSTPGLRGQSGGPVFDVEARLCGLQSLTTHFDLGFDAVYQRDGKPQIERQFLNVGQAVHVDDIAKFLDEQGVSYTAE